ncbi:uncharacterized protein LOC107785849 [Nicotiana tabacum]|uniref:Uncharacterized protein LOC107785849 n=1 Tax=Nicotiana tabacum TaxID=4097 RepID=A0AC58T6T0_TOBAC
MRQMPPSTHASDSSEDDDPEELQCDCYHRMIIRPEGNEFIPNHRTTKIITEAFGRLYDALYATWSDFLPELVEQIFNKFKIKCSREDRHNSEICANFVFKCRKRLSDSFCSARKKSNKSSWVLPYLWEDQPRQWTTDKSEKRSE